MHIEAPLWHILALQSEAEGECREGTPPLPTGRKKLEREKRDINLKA